MLTNNVIQKALKDPYHSVEVLEEFIKVANEQNKRTDGVQIYPDELYDNAVTLLQSIKPDSPVLLELWDETNSVDNQYSQLLDKYPMKSITTIKDVDSAPFKNYVASIFTLNYEFVDFIASVKLNGHGVRIIYEDGKFVKATSRARRGSGNDLTTQMRVILDKSNLLTINTTQPLVEIRGELVLPLDKLPIARQYNPKIVSAFTGVSSLIKLSGKPEEWGLLDFVAYRYYDTATTPDQFSSRSILFEYLENLGFIVPLYWVLENVEVSALANVSKTVLEDIAVEVEDTDYPYYLDGIVFEINDSKIFNSIGQNIKYDFGNIALKVGKWSQLGYHGFVQYIEFNSGNIKLTPVAIVSNTPNKAQFQYQEGSPIYTDYNKFVQDYGDKVIAKMDQYILNYSELGVITSSGNVVRAVPLYELSNIVKYGIEAQSPITFNYGGEAGVVTTFDDQAIYFNEVE